MDHNTKRQKNFAFIRFQHEESVKYAVELFRGIKLFGQSLSMQNRKTGVGMQQNRHQNDNGQRMQTVFFLYSDKIISKTSKKLRKDIYFLAKKFLLSI